MSDSLITADDMRRTPALIKLGEAMHSNEIKDVAAALIAVQGETAPIERDAKGNYGTYASLEAVVTAVQPLLVKNGLAWTSTTSFQDGMVIVRTTIMHAATGQWMASEVPIRPRRDDAHGVGSAITYGRRYGLSALVGLAQSDDDGKAAVSEPRREELREPTRREEPKRGPRDGGVRNRSEFEAPKKVLVIETTAQDLIEAGWDGNDPSAEDLAKQPENAPIAIEIQRQLAIAMRLIVGDAWRELWTKTGASTPAAGATITGRQAMHAAYLAVTHGRG